MTKVVNESRIQWEQKLSLILWAYQMVYKIAAGTTLFQFLNGLNAILPIELLVQTLLIAIDLQWIGHELSKQVNELEKLVKMRL